jgi:hypothetical protein
VGEGAKIDPANLICGNCKPFSAESTCPKHGAGDIIYKCQFCCEVSALEQAAPSSGSRLPRSLCFYSFYRLVRAHRPLFLFPSLHPPSLPFVTSHMPTFCFVSSGSALLLLWHDALLLGE